ncbi:hypothetical protein HDK90DRAFT_183811 [Phyllosticta capitalensis]|uniref:histidine kinase n=1 Tax=Phyllosticta capitalensis TaxID=121624 RepID=A0ABR1YX47_9PEZI
MKPKRPRRHIPYFPKAERIFSRSTSPTAQSPYVIYEPDTERTPLALFDETANEINYGGPEEPGAAWPPKPSEFWGNYLMPTLTRNERLRLTMMWYHTRDLAEDHELLQRLQTTLGLVKSFVGWPYVICGLMDNHTYTRLVTEGLPLSILPRKETMCAHTINSRSGMLVVPNMLEDRRFARSPHAEYAGLRSYGSAVLRCTTESGECVALGSLCVAASVEKDLPTDKQAALAQFADILSAEIVNRSRNMRQRQRQNMADHLIRLREEASSENAEDLVLQALRDTYPTASVISRDSDDDMVELDNRDPVSYTEFENGLWEDTELLEKLIQTRNYEKLTSDQTIRAIAQRCRKRPHPRYLIVASNDVQMVFDDIDAWFVEACGVILFDFYQEYLLREALQAKDTFTKSINHHLRTPIHGILASVEMLAEELSANSAVRSARNADEVSSTPVSLCSKESDEDKSSNGSGRHYVEFATRAHLYLTSVKDCGRELMSTVNNMLMLNRWADSSRSMKPASLYELNQLEAEMVRDIGAMLPEAHLASTSILFDCQLSGSSIVIIDIGLLKQCLEALISNAIQSTPDGSVLVVISATKDYTVLQFDVIDSGCGISQQVQEKIFHPYEKGDSHSRGIGLGLTIASKIANAMNGHVYLVSSEVDRGSHFRAEFHNPGFACPTAREEFVQPGSPSTARTYYEVPTGESRSALVANFLKYLEHRGYDKSDESSQNALHVVRFTESEDDLRSLIKQTDRHAVTVCLIPSSAKIRHFGRPLDGKRTFFIEGPFLSTKLSEALGKIEATIHPSGDTRRDSCPVGSPQGFEDLFDRKLRITDPIHALLVDDNAINLRILKMYCEKRRIPYVLAVDGQEAIDHYTSNLATSPFNLVLMDLQMPVCGGITATKSIRALERDSESTPAVMFIVTGQDSPEDKSNSKNAGADEFYVKPMSIKTLDAGIGQYFEQIARL